MALRAKPVTRVRGGILSAVRNLFGAPERRAEAAYDGGGDGRRTRNWLAEGGGPNMVSLGNLPNLRRRSRDLVRKVPWLISAVESTAADIVGTGIRPLSQFGDAAKRAEIDALWERQWIFDADADATVSAYGQQLLAVRTMIEAGECFVRKRKRRLSDGLSVPLQLQILEPEFVPLSLTAGMTPAKGNTIKQGIEFDSLGRRVAYWMYRNHPYDLTGTGDIDTYSVVRVPADEVLHIYKPMRPGQIRGLPWLHSVIIRARDLLEYEDAEVVRKKTAAMFLAFVKKNSDSESPLPDDSGDYPDDRDDDRLPLSLEPGTIQELDEGEEMQFSQPADSGASFEPFVKMQLRAFAVAIGTTYEAMSGDHKDANFSTARIGRINLSRRNAPIQEQFIFQYCRPVRRWFMDAAVVSGALNLPGYADNPRPYLDDDWVAPGWPYTDPEKEVKADVLAIQAGLASRKGKARERGKNVENIDRDQADDNARADAAGLEHVSDGRKAVKVGGSRGASGSEGEGA